MIFHSQETDCNNNEERYCCRYCYIHSEIYHQPIQHSSYDTCHCVYLLLEYHRNRIEKHVTDHASRTSRYCTHYYCHPERMPHIKRFLHSCDSEKCKTKCIKYEPSIIQFLDVSRKDHHEQLSYEGTYYIYRCSHPKRTHAKQYISYCTSTYSNCYATDEATKPVKVLACRLSYARNGKGKRTKKLDDN